MSNESHFPVETSEDGGLTYMLSPRGFVIGERGGKLLRYNTDTHFITMGKTGGGKGVGVAIPNLLSHPGSVVSIELAGTTAKTTRRYREFVLKQKIYVIDPFKLTTNEPDYFNPMDLLDPSDHEKFVNDCKNFADIISKTPEGNTDTHNPYFQTAPQNLLMALIAYVKTAPELTEGQRNFHYLTKLLKGLIPLPGTEGEGEDSSSNKEVIEKRWGILLERLATDTSEYRNIIASAGSEFLTNQGEGSRDVRSVLGSWLFFALDNKYLEKSTLDISKLSEGNTTLYVVMPDSDSYRNNSAWFRLLIESTIKACPVLGDGGQKYKDSDNRILFMLDEFTQLGKLSAVDDGMVTARQKGITFWCIFQDYARLKKLYGEESANSFLGSASCIQALRIMEPSTAQILTEYMGRKVVFIPSKSTTRTTTTGKTITYAETSTLGESLAKNSTYSVGKTISVSVADQTGYSCSYSKGTSNSSATSYGNGGGSSSTSSDFNSVTDTTSNSRTDTRGEADTETTGGGATETSSTSKAIAKGTNDAESLALGETINYTPHIIPAMDKAELYELLSIEGTQLLIIQDPKEGLKTIFERLPIFYNVPGLKERADGILPPRMWSYELGVKHPAVLHEHIIPQMQFFLPKQIAHVGPLSKQSLLTTALQQKRINLTTHPAAFELFDKHEVTLDDTRQLIDAMNNGIVDARLNKKRRMLSPISKKKISLRKAITAKSAMMKAEAALIMQVIRHAQKIVNGTHASLESIDVGNQRAYRNVCEYYSNLQIASKGAHKQQQALQKAHADIIANSEYLNNVYMPALHRSHDDLLLVGGCKDRIKSDLHKYWDIRQQWGAELQEAVPPAFSNDPKILSYENSVVRTSELSCFCAPAKTIELAHTECPVLSIKTPPQKPQAVDLLSLIDLEIVLKAEDRALLGREQMSLKDIEGVIDDIETTEKKKFKSIGGAYKFLFKQRHLRKSKNRLVQLHNQLAKHVLEEAEKLYAGYRSQLSFYEQSSIDTRNEWNVNICTLDKQYDALKSQQDTAKAAECTVRTECDSFTERADRLQKLNMTIACAKNKHFKEIAGWDIYDHIKRQTIELKKPVAEPQCPENSTDTQTNHNRMAL